MERRPSPSEQDPMARASVSSSQRKLDLTAPLLSVLRHAPPGGSCEFVGLGSLRSPGSVPFFWENSPGHPKAMPKELLPHYLFPAIPPPPGPGGRAQGSTNRSLDQERLQISYNGRDGGLSSSEAEARLAGNGSSRQADHHHHHHHHHQQQQQKEKHGKNSGEVVGVKAGLNEDNESEGDAFSDAADTFDQTEDPSKASEICSLDCPNPRAGHTDPRARDFIMRRFLPAAKAMVVESPAPSFSQSEGRNQKKFQLSHIGQTQRSSIPRLPFANKLASLTGKTMGVDSEEEHQMDEFEIHSKGCGLLPFRLSVQFSSPARSKPKSRLHLLQFSRQLRSKQPSDLQPKNQSSVAEDVSESSESEDEHGDGGSERSGSQFKSGKPNFIGNGVLNRTMQSPQQISTLQRILKDTMGAYGKVSTSLPTNEKKGFLGLPTEVALALSRKKADTLGVFDTDFTFSPKPKNLSVSRYDEVANRSVGFSSPLAGAVLSPPGDKHGKGSGSHKACESDLLEGDRSEETNTFSRTSDVESIFGDGSPRVSSKIGETSIIDDKINLVDKVGDNFVLHSKNTSSGIKALSGNASEEVTWRRKYAKPFITPHFGGVELQKFSAQQKAEGDAPCKQQCFEHSYKSPLLSELVPPLPKAPSEPWLWRAAASPTPASVLGRMTSGTTKEPGLPITKGTNWEALVKSGIAQPGHLRYSEELLNKNLSINAHSGPNLALSEACNPL